MRRIGNTRGEKGSLQPRSCWPSPIPHWEREGGTTHWNCKKRSWLGEEGSEFSSDEIDSGGIWSGGVGEEGKSRRWRIKGPGALSSNMPRKYRSERYQHFDDSAGSI